MENEATPIKDNQMTLLPDSGKRRKKQFVNTLEEGNEVNDLFAVKSKKSPRSYRRGTWFDFVASDKTGEILVKFWGGESKDKVQRLYNSFNVGDVVQIRAGVVEYYEDTMQISINEETGSIRKCTPDEYFLEDFLPELEKEKIEKLFGLITEEIENVKNSHLKSLLQSFFDNKDFVKKFIHTPSAIMYHHNYIGGNLEHTVGVIKICHTLCDIYQSLDRDLLIAGAILHDVGKIEEYKWSTIIDRTEGGNLLGHIIMGDRMIREKINELRKKGQNFPEELENQLSHIILSHHGKLEWGSPVIPKTPEACALHHADLTDSHVKNYIQKVKEENPV
jgi:3'-5' exoribonuclease